MTELEQLIALSRRFGAMPEHVQGGGGNTSLKHADGNITIKASGVSLADVTAEKGFVTIACAPLVSYFREVAEPEEAGYNALVASLTPAGGARASMESGFHAVLPGRFVMHTHSAWANLMTSSDQGLELLADLDEEFALVPYVTPGVPLSRAIADLESPPPVIFTQNHGLIVYADNADELSQLYERVNDKLRHLAGAADATYPTEIQHKLTQQDLFSEAMDRVLCPDQAIYFSMRDAYHVSDRISYRIPPEKAVAFEQMALLVSFLLSEYARRGWKPNFLTRQQVEQLLKLDSEKHRQAQCKNDR